MSPEPPDLCALAYARLRAGALSEAESLFTAALGARPRDGAALRGLAAVHHRSGRLDQALTTLDRAVQAEPRDAAAWNNRGNLLADMGRAAAALDSFDRALDAKPGLAEARVNRAIVLQGQARSGEALADYDQVLSHHPRFAPALNGRGVALLAMGRTEEARQCFAELLEIAPLPQSWNHYGLALQMLGRHDEAVAAFDHALVQPDAEILNRRAVSLQQLGRLAEAHQSLEQALALKPDNASAQRNLALLLCEEDRLDDAMAAFQRHAGMTPPAPTQTPHKLRHDRERLLYLAGRTALADGLQLPGPAVRRPDQAVEAQWKEAKPQILVVDDFLTQEGLAALRAYCLEADVWHRVYEKGYLGAMPERGFAAPLLAQIAREMRGAFPAIFRDHPLRYFWAFKYDSDLSGTPIHADQAAVNVNFWITPDAANRDPESGGLVLWDVAAPLDWDFDRYNSEPEACRQFLERSGARKIVIPHRCNRAVIFDSDLFHMTDRIAFGDSYDQRRINVTYLFGRRSA